MQQRIKAFKDVDDRTEELRDLVDGNGDIFEAFLGEFELSWLYHENALDGIVVTHAELRTALQGRPISPDTYAAIRNLKLAIDTTRQAAASEGSPTVSHALMNQLHTILTGTEKTQYAAGAYRTFIPLHRTYFHEIAPPEDIAPRMDALMQWALENDPAEEEVIQYCARFHHEFMSIFPFPRHTGKVGRLLVNYLLMRHGYLPVVFHGSERHRYYTTLKQPRAKMEGFLSDMMTNCIDNVTKYIDHALEEREKATFRRKIANAR